MPFGGFHTVRVTLQNKGRNPIDTFNGDGIELPFQYAGSMDFPGDQGTCGHAPLLPSEICTVWLEFRPIDLGEFAWDWEVKFLVGATENNLKIPLSGKTPEPGQLEIVDGDLIEFPRTALGESSIKKIAIENIGSHLTSNFKEPLLR